MSAKSQFSDLVNQYLPNMPPDEVLLGNDEADIQLFKQAYAPQQFYQYVVQNADAKLWQSYELLRNTFSRDVLHAKSDYVRWYSTKSPNPSLTVLMARCWRVHGLQRYNTDGQLTRFSIDPLSATEGIAAVSSGSCISLEEVGYPGKCIGAIAYLATRPALRKQGHGIQLYQSVEAQIQQMATRNGWELQMIVLESEAPARQFWNRCGFLYPKDCNYQQPSLDFDSALGVPIFSAVPEMLMLKWAEGITIKSPPSIDRDFLLAVVRALYDRWYIPKSGDPEFVEGMTNFVNNQIYADFERSLTTQDVPLIAPPIEK